MKKNILIGIYGVIILGLLAFILLILVVVYSIIPGLPFSGMLLNNNTTEYILKLFGNDSPFGNGFILIIVFTCLVCSYIYGKISGNSKNDKNKKS